MKNRTLEQVEAEIMQLMEERKSLLQDIAIKMYCITVHNFIPQVTELRLIGDPVSNKFLDINTNNYWDNDEVFATPGAAIGNYRDFVQSKLDKFNETMAHLDQLLENS